MNLYFRLPLVLLRARRRESLTPLDESVLQFRVLPTDLNLGGRMHTGRYLGIMELGCVDLMARIGFLELTWKQRWLPQMIAVNMRYLSSLEFLQRYELTTRLLCWDNRWVYLEQRFRYKNKTVAVGQIKAAIYGRSGTIAPGYILELLGYDPSSPMMPTVIQHWMRVT